MLSKKRINQLLDIALQQGGDFAEVFVEDSRNNTLTLEDSRIEKVRSGHDLGVGIRVITDDKISYAYTDDLTESSLKKTAKTAGAANSGGEIIQISDLTKQETKIKHPIKVMPATVEKAKKAKLLTEANKAARNYDDSIIQVMVSYIDGKQNILVANSNGLLVEDQRVHTRFVVRAIASNGQEIQTGMESPGLHTGFELFEQYSPAELGEKAAKQAVTMLNADPAPSAKLPVVINNGMGGVLFHEACGHGLEADAIQKQSSVFANQVGEQVASKAVTAVDDATVKNAWGSFGVDDEGNPAQRTTLIKDGILQDYMYDHKAASKEARNSTGNGRRDSYQSLPIPRMTNTFIEEGEYSPDEIINSVDDGFYAKKLSGGQVEPATGEFIFSVSEGYLIKNGQIADPVRGASLIGRGIDVLKNIEMVGNNLELAPGMCGKQGQSVPAGVGQPTLLVNEMTIGGTKGSEQ